MDAIGLDRTEANFRRGTYLEQPRLPAGLGCEAAGEALEVGPGVSRWCPGGRVSVVPAFSQNDYPVYAEQTRGLSGLSTPLPAGRYAPVWLRRYHVFEVTADGAALRRAEHFVRAGLTAGSFAPVVDPVFDFDDVIAAHEYLDSPDRAPANRCSGSATAGPRRPGNRLR